MSTPADSASAAAAPEPPMPLVPTLEALATAHPPSALAAAHPPRPATRRRRIAHKQTRTFQFQFGYRPYAVYGASHARALVTYASLDDG